MRRSAGVSRERLLCVFEALLHLFRRRAGAAIFVFDVRRDRPPLLLEQLQHVLDRCVALAPRRVVPLVLLAILEMQVGDVLAGLKLTGYFLERHIFGPRAIAMPQARQWLADGLTERALAC